ncbi:MAG TPA: hypothetical protein VHT52_14165, partial [Stellaceae bacterium]|nr:hypothetical protein [Stellaceae bacterium]
KDGKGGEPVELANRLREIAIANNDHNMLHLLDRGDMAGVDKLLKYLDGQGQDLKKAKQLLDIEAEKLRIERMRQQLEKEAEKRRAEEEALAPYRGLPSTGGATPMAPGPAPATPAAPGIGSPADMGPAPAGSTPAPEMFDPTKPPPPDADRTAAADDAFAPPAAEPAEDAAGGPRAEAEPADAAGEPQAQAAAAPAADLAGGARAAGAPVMAADDEPDQPSPTPAAGAPAAGAAGAAPPADAPFKMLPSHTLDAARQQGFTQTDLIEQTARAAANRQLTIQDYRNIPPRIRPFVGARAQEISREYDRILNDPKITGDKVYDAIKTFDPGFAATLRSYVDGKAPPPASAWQNPIYRDRVVGLGNKVDPNFTYLTFPTRKKTLSDFSSGLEGRTVTSINTAYDHGAGLLYYLDHRPGLLARSLGGIAGIGPMVASKEERQELGALQNYINTFNNEYESALARGGRATVTARAGQEHELPLVMGDKEAMRGNILSKIEALRARAGELQRQFEAGTGIQPKAMDDWVGRVSREDTPAVQQMIEMQRNMQRKFGGGGERPAGSKRKDGYTIEKIE